MTGVSGLRRSCFAFLAGRLQPADGDMASADCTTEWLSCRKE